MESSFLLTNEINIEQVRMRLKSEGLLWEKLKPTLHLNTERVPKNGFLDAMLQCSDLYGVE